MPKFAIGQQVKVVEPTTYGNLVGQTGTVYSVDDTEPYLYAVDFDSAQGVLFVEFELEAVA